MPNKLIHQTSPYLLQHAHNPVDWYPWGNEALERAQTHNLPILVSIGYSACHWCHVMERESFENHEVAAFMNANFVNIKVDREERPDIDQIYMDAVTALTGHGGWPLNCFLLPNTKPFYGGTYFPPKPAHNRPDWLSVLHAIKNAFDNKPAEIEQQANQLTYAIIDQENRFFKTLAYPQESLSFNPQQVDQIFDRLSHIFDTDDGGFGNGQKFPQTLSLRFALAYHHYTRNPLALQHVLFSLDKMIKGGIYDHLGGGFARYTVDKQWLIPHFEKMLYDNALLISTLASAYKITKSNAYKHAIEQTLDWVERELTHPNGGFYSAYDADSEGVEGKFYTWQKSEIDEYLQHEAPIFNLFYGVTEQGNWDETNILQQKFDYETLAPKIGYDPEELQSLIARCRKQLFRLRQDRQKPLLDDKIILGWNALQISAYCHAYQALGTSRYLTIAEQTMQFLLTAFAHPLPEKEKDTQLKADDTQESALFGSEQGRLYHTYKNGVATYPAFLDDYAFLIDALLNLHQATLNATYLEQAQHFTQHVIAHFKQPDGNLFFYTPSYQHDILLRKKDNYDGATPSGNATMASCLHRLGLLLDQPAYTQQAAQMVASITDSIEKYPSSFSLWATTLLQMAYPTAEVAIIGTQYATFSQELLQQYHPNLVLMAAQTPNHYPLLNNKPTSPETLVYICQNYACQAPVNNVPDAVNLLLD